MSAIPRPAPVARPRLRRRILGFCIWGVLLALSAWNAWWLARDLRPLPELPTVADWVRRERFDDAETALREHVRRSPHHGEALILLASVRAARGDDLGAARLLHDVPLWWPRKWDMLLLEGRLDLEHARARAAEAAWTQCAADDPLRPPQARAPVQAARELLTLYGLERRTEEARALVWRVAGQASRADQEALLRALMTIELAPGPASARAARLREFVAADPFDWQARRALAVAEQALGHPAEARKLIDDCLRDRPDDPVVRLDLLGILRDQGRDERFRAEVARLPSSMADDAAAWNARGIAREQKGDLSGAADADRRALALGGDTPELLSRLSLVEQRLGQKEQAARDDARAQRLAALRLQLDAAFRAYLEASSSETGVSGTRDKAIARLAAACEELGREREAEAWARCAPEP